MPPPRQHRPEGSTGRSQLKRLLIRPGAIGDCIVSLPALKALKADYTEVWVAGQNVPLIRFADRVRSIASTGIDAFPPRLDALTGFDEIVSWYGSNRPDFRDALQPFNVRFFEALPSASGLHATDFYMRQVGGRDGATPRIHVPRQPEDFVAIHPFSGSPRKNWTRFADLAALLPAPAVFCASPEQPWPGAVCYDDLYELAKWLARARLYIGNDSGITHLAAAVGVPVVAIFLSTDPAVWAPRGLDVQVLMDPDVETVLTAAHSQLR